MVAEGDVSCVEGGLCLGGHSSVLGKVVNVMFAEGVLSLVGGQFYEVSGQTCWLALPIGKLKTS